MKLNILHSIFTLTLIFLLITVSTQTKAQKETQIFGMAGYMVNSNVTVAQGDLSFDDGVSYGFGIDVGVEREMQAEISWSMSPSYARIHKVAGGSTDLSTVYIHHFQAGALVEPNKKKDVSPFGLITLGASLFSPTEKNTVDHWTFTFALGGGVKIYVSDKIGIRLQGRLLVPMVLSGGSVWFGTGGAGVAVGTYTTIVEGDFSGGIFFRL
jgi:opacity protein-like surface antigen